MKKIAYAHITYMRIDHRVNNLINSLFHNLLLFLNDVLLIRFIFIKKLIKINNN